VFALVGDKTTPVTNYALETSYELREVRSDSSRITNSLRIRPRSIPYILLKQRVKNSFIDGQAYVWLF